MASCNIVSALADSQAPNPLPAELTRLVVRDPPPDITLAVRVSELPENGRVGDLDEEVFDELGVEVVDELGGADEDDERRECPFPLLPKSPPRNYHQAARRSRLS